MIVFLLVLISFSFCFTQAADLGTLEVQGSICDLSLSRLPNLEDVYPLVSDHQAWSEYRAVNDNVADLSACWQKCLDTNALRTPSNPLDHCNAVMMISGTEFSPAKPQNVCYEFNTCAYTKVVGLPAIKQDKYTVYTGLRQESDNRHDFIFESSNLT